MSEISTYANLQVGKPGTTDYTLIRLFTDTKRSEKTREQYTYSIRMLVGFIGKPLGVMTLQDAVDYHQWLKERYESAHSVKLHINVAKALCAFGVKLNYLRTNVFAVIKTDTPPEVTHHRILTEEEVLKLIDAPKRQRDKLLLRLIYAAGLRVSEVCNLTWGDLSSDGVLYIQAGKGQKDRFVTLSESMVKRLVAFKGDATNDTPIFQSQAKNDRRRKSATARLDESQVHRIVKAAAESAGISADASAHWLRHSHASHSLDRGASIVTVRDTLGHSSIATTNKYLHSKRKDSSALHLAV
jgi:integrase/recombinase XerD